MGAYNLIVLAHSNDETAVARAASQLSSISLPSHRDELLNDGLTRIIDLADDAFDDIEATEAALAKTSRSCGVTLVWIAAVSSTDTFLYLHWAVGWLQRALVCGEEEEYCWGRAEGSSTMDDYEDTLSKLEERLESDVRAYHVAASIADSLVELTREMRLEEDPRVRHLAARFIQLLPVWGMEDLLVHQVGYAVRLAVSDGELMYEEMFKLFCLCDEILALESLGLSFPSKLKEQYQVTVRDRFRREPRRARGVATSLVREWKAGQWWYRENLEASSDR